MNPFLLMVHMINFETFDNTNVVKGLDCFVSSSGCHQPFVGEGNQIASGELPHLSPSPHLCPLFSAFTPMLGGQVAATSHERGCSTVVT
jgi:hypothetical protein